MDIIKVLIVDDQKLFAESLRTVLETRAKDIRVIGIAANGKMAVESTAKKLPDVILMDVRMPEMNGVECTRIITGKFPNIKILILTTFDDDEYIVEAVSYGAAGYLLKDMAPNELISAIRSAYQGEIMISTKVSMKLAKKLFKESRGDEDAKPQKPPNSVWLKELSNREKDILRLLVKGYDNKEIAKHLYIAEQTVKNYLSIIYLKMGVRDRVQASLLAVKAGLE